MEFEHFLTQLRTESEANRPRLSPSDSLMAALQQLGHGSVAIYTLQTDAKYRELLVTPSVRKIYEVSIGAADLNRRIFAFRLALQNPSSDPRPLAQDLYNILVRPLEEDLKAVKAETLFWSLDGVLRYLPLAALHDGNAFLTERYRLSTMTPAALAGLAEAPRAEKQPIVFGVSQGHEGFAPLPNVAEEAKRIQAIAGGKILLDSAFTESSFEEELRGGHHPVVHIASHFVLRPDASQSFLLLGDGAHMSLAEIGAVPRLFSGVDLLVLSGSETSLGLQGADGREVEGFSMIAMQLGAKSVIGTLWSVADDSTATFMSALYRELVHGSTKADALRGAQLELMRDPRYAHPYYWAPFVLTGNPL
jgi:CHAT domain-containing protein